MADSRIQSDFMVNRAKDNPFVSGGLRVYREYRDLGIGDATGGAGAWVEERTSDYASQSVGALGDRRTVLRRGDTCVEVHRSRIADADPFNSSVAPRTAPMVGKPYKCK